MYLRGSKLSMTRRRRRINPLRILILVLLIGAMVYVNQVVVPATGPLFIPTPTPTRSPESYVADAQGLVEAGKIPQAIVAYEAAIKVDPRNPSSYIALARLQIYSGLYAEATTNADNALLLNANSSIANALRGWALGFQGEYLEASASLKQAIDLDPNNPVPYAYYAEVLALQQQSDSGGLGTLDEAIEMSQKAEQLGPNTLEAHRARGLILEITSNYEEAVAELEAAVSINPNIADLHIALGRNYLALEYYDQAVEQFNNAIPLDPTNPLPKWYLSRTYFRAGEFSKAILYGEQAIKDNPTDPYLHGNLGMIYRRAEDLPRAIASLGLAVRGGATEDGAEVAGLPLDYGRVAEYYYNYGLALADNGQCGEALQIAQALLNGVAADEIAVYNAQEMINICAAAAGQPTATPAVPEPTPTP